MRKLLVIGMLGLALAGCGTLKNPISSTTEATAESAYASAATAAVSYLALPWCAPGAHFAVLHPCKEISFVVKVKAADNAAYAALLQLRNFYVQNPGSTVSQLSLINAVIAAAGAVTAAIPTS